MRIFSEESFAVERGLKNALICKKAAKEHFSRRTGAETAPATRLTADRLYSIIIIYRVCAQ